MKQIKDLIQNRLEEPVNNFCKKVKVNRVTILGILNDNYKHDLRLVTIKKICKYFDVDFHEYI